MSTTIRRRKTSVKGILSKHDKKTEKRKGNARIGDWQRSGKNRWGKVTRGEKGLIVQETKTNRRLMMKAMLRKIKRRKRLTKKTRKIGRGKEQKKENKRAPVSGCELFRDAFL